MNKDRYLLVVSGPSGIGKDTVVRNLIAKHSGIELSISATTRPPRPGEVEGELYYFMDRAQFEQKIAAGDFVEYTQYAGNYYGTLRSEVEKRLCAGTTCVLVIEVNGAGNVKQMYPECTTVFIVAPSLEEHMRRMRARGSESEAMMAERLEIAKQELEHAPDYDYQLVNECSARCAEELYAILQARQTES